MSEFDTLVSHFERFPGVGVRQARRFAFHILGLPADEAKTIAELIVGLKATMVNCAFCHRFFYRFKPDNDICDLCHDGNRDRTKLMVLERDVDIQAIEQAGIYEGLYFVLGGTVPLLDRKSTGGGKIRGNALKKLVMEQLQTSCLKEIILAFAVNPDGENTARFVESLLGEVIKARKIRLSYLGRGLSTGSELEYADPETIKHALETRLSQ